MGSPQAEAARKLPSGEAPSQPREDWEAAARAWLGEDTGRPVHIVGVGNPIRQDDAVGLEIVSSLRRRLGARPSPNFIIHPPSPMPERLLSRVASSGGRMMVFDAVQANRAPGAVVSARLSDTKYGYFATHNIPLRLIPGVSAGLDRSLLVGVQPGWLDVGEELSAAVKEAKGRVVAAVDAMIGGTGNGPT